MLITSHYKTSTLSLFFILISSINRKVSVFLAESEELGLNWADEDYTGECSYSVLLTKKPTFSTFCVWFFFALQLKIDMPLLICT